MFCLVLYKVSDLNIFVNIVSNVNTSIISRVVNCSVSNVSSVTVSTLREIKIKIKKKRYVIQVSDYNFPAKTFHILEFSGCPLLCWTILIWPSLSVSVHTIRYERIHIC